MMEKAYENCCVRRCIAYEENTNVFVFTCNGDVYRQSEYGIGEFQILFLPDLTQYDGIILARDTIQSEQFAEEIRNLADNSRTNVSAIQELNSKIVAFVQSLSACSKEMLDFVDTDIMEDYKNFEKMSVQYSNDADTVSEIMDRIQVSVDFINGQISSVVQNIGGISSSVEESALGIQNVAGNVIDISNSTKGIYQETCQNAQTAEELKQAAYAGELWGRKTSLYLDKKDQVLGKTYGYRNSRTGGMGEKVYEIISPEQAFRDSRLLQQCEKGTATILIGGTNAYSGVKSVTCKITITAADNQSIWSSIF